MRARLLRIRSGRGEGLLGVRLLRIFALLRKVLVRIVVTSRGFVLLGGGVSALVGLLGITAFR